VGEERGDLHSAGGECRLKREVKMRSTTDELAFYLLYMLHEYEPMNISIHVERDYADNNSLYKRSSLDPDSYSRTLAFIKKNSFIEQIEHPLGDYYPSVVLVNINASGNAFLMENRNKYVELSIEAMMILRFIYSCFPKTHTSIQQITRNNLLNLTQTQMAQTELFDQGYVEESDPDTIILSQQGIDAVRKNFTYSPPPATTSPEKFPQSSYPSIQVGNVGAIFQSSTITSPIQAVGSAKKSTFQQQSSEEQVKILREEIESIINKSLSEVISNVELRQRRIFYEIAEQLKNEIRKTNPEPGVLQKGLATLGFLANVGGTATLGSDVFQLISQNGPYITDLANKIHLLLQALPK
jgi:hypothetical protein